jgi:hypothetical protein
VFFAAAVRCSAVDREGTELMLLLDMRFLSACDLPICLDKHIKFTGIETFFSAEKERANLTCVNEPLHFWLGELKQGDNVALLQ